MKRVALSVLALLAVTVALVAPVRTATVPLAAAAAVSTTTTAVASGDSTGTPEVHVQTQSLRGTTTTAATTTATKAATSTKATTATKAATSTQRTITATVSSATSLSRARTAYLNAMYVSVVPARERARLAGHYVLGYALAGMSCGTGCSGLFSGQARSSFSAAFFSQPVAYQRNILAHEAAHAYGFLYIAHYTTSSWASTSGWQAQFHRLDRSFAGYYDAEAWASCVAWKETGFNNRVLQIAHVCTAQAAALAMQHLV